MDIKDKYLKLQKYIGSYQKVAIAFSGGVDSTFLIKVCKETLEDNCLAITATSPTYPQYELQQAKYYAQSIGIKHLLLESDETKIEAFTKNDSRRCYFCKRELFGQIIKITKDQKFDAIFDGQNKDDQQDYRPGSQAAKELGVKSPLAQSDLSKEEIRKLSKELKLPTWNKPAQACLSSRFPYGEKINVEQLYKIEKGEELLREMGFRQFRLRHHGQLARIEIEAQERAKMFDLKVIEKISHELKKIGFIYVTMDLDGYVMGSMNKTLSRIRSMTFK